MRKKITIFIVLIIILSISLLAFSYFKLDYKKSISIKIGEKLPSVNDYVKGKKAKKTKLTFKLKSEKNKIYKSGVYMGTLKYYFLKKEVTLKVIDDEKPIIKGSKDITVYENSEIDLLKDITVNDNSKDEIKLTVEGEYDTKKRGEYNLFYVATDASGNKEKVPFKLTVDIKPVIERKVEGRIIGTTTKGYKIEESNGAFYIGGVLVANKSYKLSNSYAPGGLVSDFNNAFNKMQQDARNIGVNIYIISGYRSYYDQSYIYNNYVARDGVKEADTYSARAGHSEHQTGLAADINSLEQAFGNTKEGIWLNNNCYKYGFIIRYPKNKDNITGYMYEPWHIRYVGEYFAKELYNNGNWLTVEEYLGITSKYN